MWSGPRNISTALMRSFGNRSDTVVLDEPFYAHYLYFTGINHPGKSEILAKQKINIIFPFCLHDARAFLMKILMQKGLCCRLCCRRRPRCRKAWGLGRRAWLEVNRLAARAPHNVSTNCNAPGHGPDCNRTRRLEKLDWTGWCLRFFFLKSLRDG